MSKVLFDFFQRQIIIKGFFVTFILAFACFIGYIASKGRIDIVFLIGTICFFFIVVTWDLKLALPQYNSIVILVLIAILPFERILISNPDIVSAIQLSCCFIFVFYFTFTSKRARGLIYKEATIILIPASSFAISIFLGYLFAGGLHGKDWQRLIDVFSSLSFIFLAFIYCRDILSVKNALRVLVLCGALQLPILLMQSRGWLDFVPVLNSTRWRGAVSNATEVVRFGGSFGDSELLAEYIGLMFILSLGYLVFFASKKENLVFLLTTTSLLIAGFFTGTRGFLISMSVTFLAMLFILMKTPLSLKKKGKMLLFIFLIVFVAINILFLPGFSGYLDRFQNFKFEISNENFLNRGDIFLAIIDLAKEGSWFGYGARSMEVLGSTLGSTLKSAHSLYLGMLLIAGLPGFIAALLIVFYPLSYGYFLSKKPEVFAHWGVIFFCFFVYWGFNEVKIDFIRYPFYMDLIFFVIGMAISTFCLSKVYKHYEQK